MTEKVAVIFPGFPGDVGTLISPGKVTMLCSQNLNFM